MSIGKRSKAQTEKLRGGVYERDNNYCVACAVVPAVWNAGHSLTVQHRVGRGMGGSAQYDKTLGALLTLCMYHNFLETMDADFSRLCVSYGWSVPRWVVAKVWDISDVPVFYFDGWYYLTDTGREKISDEDARERMFQIYGASFLV